MPHWLPFKILLRTKQKSLLLNFLPGEYDAWTETPMKELGEKRWEEYKYFMAYLLVGFTEEGTLGRNYSTPLCSATKEMLASEEEQVFLLH